MRTKSSTARTGFTLVELLVVITIIGLMSGMFLIAYQGAALESRVVKTRSTIQKISDVLTARMEEYASYSVALRITSPSGVALPANAVALTSAGATSSFLRERARLLELRDMIRMEMPDHPDDIKFTTFWKDVKNPVQFQAFLELTLPGMVATGLSTTPTAAPGFFVKGSLTSRTKALMTRLSQSPWFPLDKWDKTNANAELLFLIVEGSDFNGSSAIEMFGKAEIGDTDNDGLNEFIDAFRRPIQWIRWPAGFRGATRYYPDMLDTSLVSAGRLVVNSEGIDRLGTDPGWGTTLLKPGNGLSPLVVSAGQDRAFGIRFREIDRYPNPPPPTPPPPPAVGMFPGPFYPAYTSYPSYSSAEAPWTSPGFGYALTSFTDPWYPRDGTLGLRMGELLMNSDIPEAEFSLADPRHARDNITNYDGNGASL